MPYAAEDVAAMRLVTSLTLVQAQLKSVFIVSLIVVAAILGFTVASGLYFVRGIVVPLGQVERIAASIARGELDVRLPVTGDERDEVDRLRGTINQMAEGLEETEKMKNEFISSVSHELRTPLTSIRGWVETLRTLDDPADENYRKGLEIINNETARLYNMVEELLDFSRLQNGRIRMDCRPLDLVAELTDAVLFCEARIQREGLVLSYTEPEEMIPVYADPGPSAAGVPSTSWTTPSSTRPPAGASRSSCGRANTRLLRRSSIRAAASRRKTLRMSRPSSTRAAIRCAAAASALRWWIPS
mgnify:CR=1 FL=1